MKSDQFLNETTSGAIASVSMPLGKTQKRAESVEVKGLKPVGKKTTSKNKGPYANSIVEGIETKKVSEAELQEDDLIIIPGQKLKRRNGFVPKDQSRVDHEVEMARSDLIAAFKNAKSIFQMLKDRSEEEGIEGWVQEKLIKANDYLNAVKEYYDGKMMREMSGGVIAAGGVGESSQSWQDEFADMIGQMKKSGRLGMPKSNYNYKTPEPKSKEELMSRLKELEAEFDPAYQQSDDYSFWKKQNDIASEISSIKRQLRQQGVAEGLGKDLAKLGGMAAVGIGAGIGGSYLDSKHPKIEIGGQQAYLIKDPGWGKIPNTAMKLQGADGRTYIVWTSSGKGNRTLFATPAENVKEGVAEGLSDIVKGIKRKVAGKDNPKDVEHTYARIARRDIEDANKLNNQAAYDARDKSTKRWEKVNKVVNKQGVAASKDKSDKKS